MHRVVLDSTILVSAFLAPQGVSSVLLRRAREGAFLVALSEEILAETQKVLLHRAHLRKRYPYTDEDVSEFCQALREAVDVVTQIPALTSVSRDPHDDMVIACAVAAQADHLVTRDHDLLTLKTHGQVQMVSPEDFMRILRDRSEDQQ
jgi:putative PIN family toxin of toxin-antitoxin system